MPAGSTAVVERPTARRRGVSVARALGSSTRAGIYAHLQEAEEALTVRDVAGTFDLHPNVARTHLETLADAGLVAVGLRKHPGGGRPAKLYRAKADVPDEAGAGGTDSPAGSACASLLVRLLARLLEGSSAASAAAASLAGRAHDVAASEARRLVLAGGVSPQDGNSERTLGSIASAALRTLHTLAPEARVLKAGRDWVDVAGLQGTFSLLGEARPELADAFERGLLCGAMAGAGVQVTLSDVADAPGRERVWRAHAASQGSPRLTVQAVETVDARGNPRERGVVQAMRAVTALRAGEVLEVLTKGPGSPAAFARWADRAGHELLGVERATDASGRPAIRLLIRKGA